MMKVSHGGHGGTEEFARERIRLSAMSGTGQTREAADEAAIRRWPCADRRLSYATALRSERPGLASVRTHAVGGLLDDQVDEPTGDDNFLDDVLAFDQLLHAGIRQSCRFDGLAVGIGGDIDFCLDLAVDLDRYLDIRFD